MNLYTMTEVELVARSYRTERLRSSRRPARPSRRTA